MKFVAIGNSTINLEDVSSLYEDPTLYGSIFVTMKSGKEIIISHEYKRAFKEALKEYSK